MSHNDPNLSLHQRLRSLAIKHDLDLTELNAICQVVAGYTLNHLSEERARLVLNTMIAKGPLTKQWAQELVRSL